MNENALKYGRWIIFGIFLLCAYLATSYDPLKGNKMLLVSCCFLMSLSSFMQVAYSRITGKIRVGRAKIYKDDMPLLFSIALVVVTILGLMIAGWGIAIIAGYATAPSIN